MTLTNYGTKGRTVLLSSLIILLMITASAAFVGSAAAQEASVSDKTVAADGTVDVNIAGASGESVRVSGDVDNWTIESANPGPGLAVLPQANSLPYTWNASADGDTWANLDGGSWNLTIAPPSDASVGEEYTFDVTVGDTENPVDTDSFTVAVNSNGGADDGDSSGGSTGGSGTTDGDSSGGSTGGSGTTDGDSSDSGTTDGDSSDSGTDDGDTSDGGADDGDTSNESTDDSTPGFNIITALIAFISAYLISKRN